MVTCVCFCFAPVTAMKPIPNESKGTLGGFHYNNCQS